MNKKGVELEDRECKRSRIRTRERRADSERVGSVIVVEFKV